MSKRTKIGAAYRQVVEAALQPVTQGIAAQTVTRLAGFWVMWNLFGGYDGLRAQGWERTNIWRNRKEFRAVFGVEVEDFLPKQTADIVGWREEPVSHE